MVKVKAKVVVKAIAALEIIEVAIVVVAIVIKIKAVVAAKPIAKLINTLQTRI